MNDNSCIIRGGTVVCADRVLPDTDVVVIDGRIAAIEPAGASDFDAQPDAVVGVLPIVDARGAFVAPGLIDIHSDYVENVASPRPSVVMDLNTSLYKADRELVSHGITTIFHSLSVYGAHVFDHKPIRDFGNVSALIDRVAVLRAGEERDHLIRHRLHMRVELDSVDLYDDIEEFLRSGKVDLVSFMDHTPGQGQYRDLLGVRRHAQGLPRRHRRGGARHRPSAAGEPEDDVRPDHSSGVHRARARRVHRVARRRQRGEAGVHGRPRGVHLRVPHLAGHRAGGAGARHAHHRGRAERDAGPQPLGQPQRARGRAGRRHRRVVQRLLPGGAAGRGVHAARPVRARHREGVRAGHINPAKAAGIADEVGSIAVGKRADVLLVREISCGEGSGEHPVAGPDGRVARTMPVVTRAFVGGRSVFRSHYPDQPLGYGRDTEQLVSLDQLSRPLAKAV